MDKPTAIRKPRADDRPLWDIYWGAYGYFAMHLAHQHRIFPLLKGHPKTLAEICQATGLGRRPAEGLLAISASLGFLEFGDGRYRLTPLAEDYLLPESPTYFGAQFDWNLSHPQILSLDRLGRAVATDRPAAYEAGEDMFAAHEDDAEAARQFTRAMHSASMAPALAWPEKIDLSSNRLMLDVGGGSGAHSIGALHHWPNLSSIVLDRPPVCEVAEECAAREGLSVRIKAHRADMWNDPFPAADLHFYGMIFHDWPADKCRLLAQKSFDHLERGGRIIIHEMLFDDSRTGPFPVAAFNMVMLMYIPGEQYSGRELSAMLTDAGFRDIEVKPTFGYWSIVTGVKP
jgi:cyclopropane fatty-acyl-phospholipid synthase-like methyltransferase